MSAAPPSRQRRGSWGLAASRIVTVLQDRVILKQNDVFVVSDPSGDIPAGDEAGMGLYRSDTRFLSL